MANVTISDLNPIDSAVTSMKIAVERYNDQGMPVETNNLSISQLFDLFAIIGDAPPVGSIITWMTPSIPAGYLLCDGTEFDTQLYPALALVFPTGILPNFNGRVQKQANPATADIVGALEAQQTLSHTHTMAHTHTRGSMEIVGSFITSNNPAALTSYPSSGAFTTLDKGGYGGDGGNQVHQTQVTMTASKSWTGATSAASVADTGSFGASEMRVNSLLCQFIVRAR